MTLDFIRAFISHSIIRIYHSVKIAIIRLDSNETRDDLLSWMAFKCLAF